MKKIIHFNHNDKNNLNIGDEAHVIAIQETLSDLYGKDLQVVEHSIQLLARQAVPSKPYFPKSKRYPSFVHNMYRALTGNSATKLLEECNNADLILIGGGGVYMSYLFPLNDKLIKRIKTPIVLFGVGYNHNLGAPEFSKRQMTSVQALSGKARLIAVRDRVTHDFLKTQGVSSSLMCDPAIFLSEGKSAIPKHGSVINVGINMARHGWNNQKALQGRLLDSYAELILAIRKQQPANIYYFVHHPNELKYVELLRNRGVIFDGVVNAGARETKAAYKRMDVTVSMMLHSTILAFGAGTPTLCVGYDKKNLAFMRLTGQEENYVSVNELSGERLVDIFNEIVDKREVKAQKLERTKSQLEKNYTRLANKVLGIIA